MSELSTVRHWSAERRGRTIWNWRPHREDGRVAEALRDEHTVIPVYLCGRTGMTLLDDDADIAYDWVLSFMRRAYPSAGKTKARRN